MWPLVLISLLCLVVRSVLGGALVVGDVEEQNDRVDAQTSGNVNYVFSQSVCYFNTCDRKLFCCWWRLPLSGV